MPVSASLLLIATLAAGQQAAPPAAPGTPSPSVQTPQPQAESGTQPSAGSTDRSHAFGVGAFGGSGGGPSIRYFFNDRVGVNMTAGWYRPQTRGSNSAGTSFQAAPSMVLMLNKSHQMADVDFRPYVGVGVNYVHTPTTAQTTSTIQVQGGTGMQAFGGVEMAFSSFPSIALGAEVMYHRLAVQTYNASLNSGTDFYFLFHYYMK